MWYNKLIGGGIGKHNLGTGVDGNEVQILQSAKQKPAYTVRCKSLPD